jgi:predicted DNA-binding transcriptional regulator YafY
MNTVDRAKRTRKQSDRSKSQLLRVMELDRQIRSGKYPNCVAFSADWEVSQKTIQRDIDYLRDQQGAPIEYDREKKGFCYTDPSWYLPALSLSEGELLALLMGTQAMRAIKGAPVAAQLETLYGKLSQMLPDNITVAPELLYNEFSITSGPTRTINTEVWKSVVRGLTHRRSLNIKYQRFGSSTSRDITIKPYHLASIQGEWYLFAGSDDFGGWRQYSMGRIIKTEVTDNSFTVPESFNADEIVNSSFGRSRVGKPVTVRLLFSSEVKDWILEREWHPAQKIKQRKDGSVELSFPAHGLYEVQRWVLSWGAKVLVLGPEKLSGAVRGEVKVMIKNAL